MNRAMAPPHRENTTSKMINSSSVTRVPLLEMVTVQLEGGREPVGEKDFFDIFRKSHKVSAFKFDLFRVKLCIESDLSPHPL